MSGIFKAIGKAFKAVVKTIKKVALPALAIGAVVLTGGAALGILPSVGALAGSLGLSSTLTSVLVAGAKAATFGAIGSALTGGNIIKGATTGFMVGGALGAAGALGGLGKGVQTATAAAGSGAPASTAATAAQGATAASGALPPVAAGSTFSEAFAPIASSGGGLGTVAAPVAASAAPVASIAAPTVAAVPASAGGGVMGFLNQNPMIAAMGIQGLGAGISAKAQADAQKDEQNRIAANYGDTSGLYRLPAGQGAALPDAASHYNNIISGKVMFDRNTGRIVPVGAQ